jgi:hypothetical protein
MQIHVIYIAEMSNQILKQTTEIISSITQNFTHKITIVIHILFPHFYFDFFSAQEGGKYAEKFLLMKAGCRSKKFILFKSYY